MPLKPKSGESKDQYISRCISEEINSGKSQDQSVAICIYKADEHFKSATQSVATDLPPANIDFGRVKRVIFSEDFDESVVREYKEAGFKTYILSRRKVQRKDRKTYNKLKSVGLNEDNLLFGDIKTLDKKYNFDIMLHDTEDPILNALLVRGEDISKKTIISSTQITNMTEALQSLESIKNIDMRFASVRVVFTYELRDGVSGPSELPTTRDFCKRVLGSNKAWSIDDINSLPTSHLVKMGLPADIFAFRGGFYTTKGGQRGVDTTPFCRHIWKSKIIRD